MDKILEEKGFEEGKVYAIIRNQDAYAVEVKDGKFYKCKKDYTPFVVRDFKFSLVVEYIEIPITSAEYQYLREIMNRYDLTSTTTDICILREQYYDTLAVRTKAIGQKYDVMWAYYKTSEVMLLPDSFKQLERGKRYSLKDLGLKY